MAKKTKWTFEERMQRLEVITQQLEAGTLSIEDGMKVFEEGIEHYRACQKTIEEVENKINILTLDQEED